MADEKGKIHKGKFYENELQKHKAKEYRVEKILKTKTENGKHYEFVRWIDHNSSYDSWIEVPENTPVIKRMIRSE